LRLHVVTKLCRLLQIARSNLIWRVLLALSIALERFLSRRLFNKELCEIARELYCLFYPARRVWRRFRVFVCEFRIIRRLSFFECQCGPCIFCVRTIGLLLQKAIRAAILLQRASSRHRVLDLSEHLTLSLIRERQKVGTFADTTTIGRIFIIFDILDHCFLLRMKAIHVLEDAWEVSAEHARLPLIVLLV
jgi:hypothetical protein